MGKLRFGAKIDTEMKYEARCTQIFYDKDVLDKLGMEKYLGLQPIIPAAPFLYVCLFMHVLMLVIYSSSILLK
jgi:hypothetical protein